FGRDANTPDELRAQLQQIFQATKGGLQHVLLVGDHEDVPGKQGLHIRGPTDHYYRAIDTADYATDINGPDVNVGRFPAANEEQLAAMVAKSIRYQTRQFKNVSWVGKAAWLATHDRWQVAEGTHNHVIQTHTAPSGYIGMVPFANMPGGDQLYPITHKVTRQQIMSAFGEGRGWIQYSGHGTYSGWEDMNQAEVRALASDALPFVVSNSCLTGDYSQAETFAETWIRHPQGAIFFWGSVDLTYWDEDDILEKKQVDGMYLVNRRTFGEITNYALSELWRHLGGEGRSKYYWETYTSFGDPSIEYLLHKHQ
ncbi:MAG TPA: C25 family cysteine peptidase, partial [Bdellovibrionales bacterium]|nr:C25 family cysteine peptidase [Bdellovibrionales bacterium]